MTAIDITERLRQEFRVRDWWPGMDSFDSARGETVPHPVAREAAAEIEALREIVRLLGVYPFTGSRHDAFIAAAVQVGAPASAEVIAAVKRALPTAPDTGSEATR